MKIGCVDNTNFQGKLILTGKFDQKPQECVNLVKNDINEMIKSKDFNLYMFQNYLKKAISISSGTNENKIQKYIQTTSEPSEYIRTVKEIIKEEENLNKQYKKQEQLPESNNTDGFVSLFSKIFNKISLLINKNGKTVTKKG